jgi:hypothetical protein
MMTFRRIKRIQIRKPKEIAINDDSQNNGSTTSGIVSLCDLFEIGIDENSQRMLALANYFKVLLPTSKPIELMLRKTFIFPNRIDASREFATPTTSGHIEELPSAIIAWQSETDEEMSIMG